MLAHFMLSAPSRHARLPERDDAAGWLALARHHGLPTRLLDWSEAPMTAMFFAAYPPNRRDGALWALNPYLLNDRLMGLAGILLPGRERGAGGLFIEAFSGKSSGAKRIAAVQPHEIDFRMLLQLARFTVHGTASPIEKLIHDEQVLRKYVIPGRAKIGIAGELEALGFRRSSLFPDLDTLADFLGRLRYKETPGAKESEQRTRLGAPSKSRSTDRSTRGRKVGR